VKATNDPHKDIPEVHAFALIMHGLGPQFLWSQAPWFTLHLLKLVVAFANFWIICFPRSFLDTPGTHPGLDRTREMEQANLDLVDVNQQKNQFLGIVAHGWREIHRSRPVHRQAPGRGHGRPDHGGKRTGRRCPVHPGTALRKS